MADNGKTVEGVTTRQMKLSLQTASVQSPALGAPIIVPPHLMVSTMDADSINAHIAEYTNWLIDNKLNFTGNGSQDSGNGLATLQNQQSQSQPLASTSSAASPNLQPQTMQANKNGVNNHPVNFSSRILFDSLADDASNVDQTSDVEGHSARLGKKGASLALLQQQLSNRNLSLRFGVPFAPFAPLLSSSLLSLSARSRKYNTFRGLRGC